MILAIKRTLHLFFALLIVQSSNLFAEGLDLSHSDPTTDSFTIHAYNASPAIVKIAVFDAQKITYGSGFLVSSNGYIVTNTHLLKNAIQISVYFKEVQIPAAVVAMNIDEDITILKIEGIDFPYLTLGNSDTVRVNQWTTFVGNPFSLQPFVSKAIIGGLDLQGRFLFTDDIIESSNSDGVLLTLEEGQVIAVSSSLLKKQEGLKDIGVAIPSNRVKALLPN